MVVRNIAALVGWLCLTELQMVKIMGWNTCLYVYEGTGSFVLTCSCTYTLMLAMKIAKPPYYLIKQLGLFPKNR